MKVIIHTSLFVPRRQFSPPLGSRKRFKALDNMLHVVGLNPMAMGMSHEPVPTRQNSYGYSEPTTSKNCDGAFNYVPTDDVTRWAHDKKRLYNIMLNAFHESTHYLCSDSFTLCDGIAIYRRMHEHFYGHTEADINRLRRLLQIFKGSTGTYFKEDLVKFTTLMTEFEYAQARLSTEQERLQFLHNAFIINDPRPNVKAYFMTCHSNIVTYHQTFERSVRYFEYALPEKPVKIAVLSTTCASSSLAHAFSATNASTITLLLSQQQLHLLLVNHNFLPHLAQLLSPTRTGPRPRESIPQSSPSQ